MSKGRAPRRHGQGLDTLVDCLREGFVVCRMIRDDQGEVVDYVITDANDAFVQGFGRPIIGERLRALRPEMPDSWFKTCGEVLKAGKDRRLEYWDPVAERWYDAHMSRLSDDELVMLYVDVTRRKTELEREQERFKELNHRVKNNLNLVAAMLALQGRTADLETRLALDQAAARVHSIAEVHNLLHQSGSSTSVRLDQYLSDLCRKLERSLAPAEVTILVEAAPAEGAIEQAVELGVIVNELLTNALKYAYEPGAKGEVLVEARPQGGSLFLSIRDFGRGFSEARKDGLGLKLVRSLVQQNGGTFRIHADAGTYIEVEIPLAVSTSEQQRLL